MKHLGNVECIDCGGSHDIYANPQGLLTSLEKCNGRTPQGTATPVQLTEISDNIRAVEVVIGELKGRFDEGDWDQIQALTDEATVRLNSIHLTAKDVKKS
jgi:hypothetical protein